VQAVPLFAQDNAVQENGAAAAQAKPGEQPPPANAAAPNDWERLIYLPYKNLKQAFEKEGSAVFMSYGQFLKMWDKARMADPRVPAKPPVSAVITEAAYTGNVADDVAQVEAVLTVQVLGKPWVELPIQFGDAAIGKMTPSDDKILLQATGTGTYSLLFPKAGEFKIKLDLSTRVRTSPDGRSLEIDCPPSGITTFALTVPAGDQTVEIVPQAVVAPQASLSRPHPAGYGCRCDFAGHRPRSRTSRPATDRSATTRPSPAPAILRRPLP